MKTILIVEDTPDLLMNLTDLLEMEGYRVVGCANAKTALQLLKVEIPDVLITDLSMPDTDGFELIRMVRLELNLKNLPVVIFSARPKEENFLKGKSLNITKYITKPCDTEVFVQHIEAIFNNANNEEN